jgi:tetratricopeptide (TPR) repeat protein
MGRHTLGWTLQATLLAALVGCASTGDTAHEPHGHEHGHGHGHEHGHSHDHDEPGPVDPAHAVARHTHDGGDSHTHAGELAHSHEHEAEAVLAAARDSSQALRGLSLGPAAGDEPKAVAGLREQVVDGMIDHDFPRAIDSIEALLEERPDDLWALMLLSDAHLELGRIDEAEHALQRVLDLRPGGASYFRAAYLLHLRGDDVTAIEVMDLAIGALRDPAARAWATAERGELQRFSGQLDAAQGSYDDALRLDPRSLTAMVGRARIALARGDLDDAARLLELAPRRADVLGLLAWVQRARGAEAQAREALREALALGARDPHHARYLVGVLADHGLDAPLGVGLAREELELRPGLHIRELLGWALLSDGQPTAALAELERVLAVGLREPEVLFHAGLAALAAGEAERGQAWLSEACALDPGLRHHPRAVALDDLR